MDRYPSRSVSRASGRPSAHSPDRSGARVPQCYTVSATAIPAATGAVWCSSASRATATQVRFCAADHSSNGCPRLFGALQELQAAGPAQAQIDICSLDEVVQRVAIQQLCLARAYLRRGDEAR